MELGKPDEADRYRKIVADEGAIDRLMVDLLLEAHAEAPEGIVPGLDATDDPLHGEQEGRFLHGCYGHCCYLPLYITCGGHVPVSRLRTADIDASEGALDEVIRIVGQIREAWPDTRILLRGDSGLCRDGIMEWRQGSGVDFLFGLARNARPVRRIGRQMRRSRSRCVATGEASRRKPALVSRRSAPGPGQNRDRSARKERFSCRHYIIPFDFVQGITVVT